MSKITALVSAAVALSLACVANAAQITGGITFSGGAFLDTNNVATATQVTGWNGITVSSHDGDFAGFVADGNAVSLVGPWSFVSGPIDGFWSVAGFNFDLVSSSISTQGPSGLIVTGGGWISGNGFDPTWATWNFSTQNPSAAGRFSISASGEAFPTPVPDDTATASLVGLSVLFLAIGWSSRRRRRSGA